MPVQEPVEAVSEGVRVSVSSFYLPQHSQPDREEFVFGYRVTLVNEGDSPILVTHRHWEIIDGEGRREVVDGEGVVGRQPRIAPAESFRYSSFARIATHWGTMEGHYAAVRGEDQIIHIRVPRFMLTNLSQAESAELVSRELV